jgi:hypothetical protein
MSGLPGHFVTDQFQHFFKFAAGDKKPGERCSTGSDQIQQTGALPPIEIASGTS